MTQKHKHVLLKSLMLASTSEPALTNDKILFCIRAHVNRPDFSLILNILHNITAAFLFLHGLFLPWVELINITELTMFIVLLTMEISS